MKRSTEFLFVSLICAAWPAPAEECHSNSNAVDVTWSRAETIVSPECNWSIEIQPGGGDIAQAKLKRRDGVDELLFSIERSGTIHWNGPSLVFEDRRFSNSYRLLVFDLTDPKEGRSNALRLDALVRKRVDDSLGPGETVAFYFPKFVAWTPDGLAISVGVETTHGASGPFSFKCFGFDLALHPGRVVSAFSESGVRSKYQSRCQEFP